MPHNNYAILCRSFLFFKQIGTFGKVFVLMCILCACATCRDSKPQTASANSATHSKDMNFKKIPLTYPFSRKDTTVSDVYFGKTIKDPYRWLENDRSAETKDWVQKQNLVTFGYLSQIPQRAAIKARLERLFDYEKYGTPFKKAGKYYFFKNDGLQNQSVLYEQENLDAPARVLLDPNKFSADGTSSLQEMAFSRNGRYLAYAVSTGGSDWRTVEIKDLKTGELLPDRLEWVKFSSIAWYGYGFYYTRYPAPTEGGALTAENKNGGVYYHRLGKPQAEDAMAYNDPQHPDRYFGGATTEDERFLSIYISESTTGNALYIKDLSKKNSKFEAVAASFENEYAVVDNLDGKLIVLTNRKAPRQRLVLIDGARPQEKYWETLVPEDTADVLQSAAVCGDKIVCHYLHNAAAALKVFSLDGKPLGAIELPEFGSVGEISGEKGDIQAFFSFSSFLRPSTIFSLDVKTLETAVFKAPKVDFNPDLYTTEQVWYSSKDGTEIPMFITRKKHIAFDGNSPALLYGYGGFNVSVTPAFSPSRAALLENNGVYAVANIRGGGEFGEAWHLAGTKCKKQNVFDDFIAAAEYLIAKKYTAPARLAIQGGSNGGLLVGACMTQRPDLFGVCFPQVGVLDMLRYHKFTIGYAWASDYGRSDKRAEFKCLLAYSPLHRLEKKGYPATLITTADHDDRVVPAHSFKFAATLQEYQQGEAPALIRIETSAGHGAGKPTGKIIDEAADLLSFMFHQMEVKAAY
jgi:prolyl oligopeptidase